MVSISFAVVTSTLVLISTVLRESTAARLVYSLKRDMPLSLVSRHDLNQAPPTSCNGAAHTDKLITPELNSIYVVNQVLSLIFLFSHS